MAEQFLCDCKEAGEEWCSVCGRHGTLRVLGDEPRIFCIRCGSLATVGRDSDGHLIAVWDMRAEA